MLVGDGGNIAVQMGEQGALVVDTGAGQLDGGTRPGGYYGARIYSARNASTGEMDAARLAGMRAANRAQMANALVAALSASGSQLATP